MLSINTNLSSLIAQQSMSSATNKLNQAIERMTTGYKINGAKDNAANYSIATNMTTKINSYMVAEDNVAMGLDMLSSANGSLDQISDKLTRLRSLATQAGNGTYGTQSLTAINSEANALVDEINRIYSTAEYNGRKLLDSYADSLILPDGTDLTPKYNGFIQDPITYTDEKLATMTSISDVSTFTSGKCYSISSAEELARLAELTNSGVNTTGATFVLANDIDLKEWCEAHATDGGWTPIGVSYDNCFRGTFDGNGHVIANLYINRPTQFYRGLFGVSFGATIKNVGIESGSVIGHTYVGGLSGISHTCDIANVFSFVDIEATGSKAGVLIGETVSSIISYCYTEGNICAPSQGGGLIGGLFITENKSIKVTNCFTNDNTYIFGNESGGLIGRIFYSDVGDALIENCISLSDLNTAPYYNPDKCNNLIGFAETPDVFGNISVINCKMIDNGLGSIGVFLENGINNETIRETLQKNVELYKPADNIASFQVGCNSDALSQINVLLGLNLEGLSKLGRITLDTMSKINQIDTLLSIISSKATEYGAVQNRLESALDEIAIQYDNLVSSRSTLRDADIAEVSSQYIQQQILQQASATLLATANQSPSIALQLI